MHEILIRQYKDDDDDIITTAETDPPAVSVSLMTTGRILDISVEQGLRPLGPDGVAELVTGCAQAAFASRYDPLPTE